ncbi:hypothetical protein F0562_014782 [Nyssa sinensis]|uniref:Uncharacterized protein n=1 Tax=Nyssa sinensis TaxID=561372 RepID=A0A5J4ZRZ5_9ASTE|nr:hypothetical protein F0562_014782 [Nyssa sinensis]
MVSEALGAMDYSVEATESGVIDPSFLLEQIELQISKAKEEAFSRKDILDKVEKWFAACEEEFWLEDYNRDDNRYNAGRGTHLILKRAEKARALVNKIPAMVEALISKVMAWEKERGVEFSYDGGRLLSMLEQYSILKQEKELEHQRQRDQKKLQGQLIAEQEALFGSKRSPSKSGKKLSKTYTGGASYRRFSLGGVMLQTPNPEKIALSSRLVKNSSSAKQYTTKNLQNHHQGGSALSSGKKKYTDLPAKHHSKASNAHEIESPPNKTPRTMPIPMPTTPSTVSTAMQTAATPATPYVPRGDEGMEYSFEERRAGFILTKTYPKSALQD